jgi:hypothetical protein
VIKVSPQLSQTLPDGGLGGSGHDAALLAA